MKVFLFNRSAKKAHEIKQALNVGVFQLSPITLETRLTHRAQTNGVYVKRGLEKKSIEDRVADLKIKVDSSLDFKAKDIAEDFSFGNGASSGAIRLKSGEWKECAWIVVPDNGEVEADAKYNLIVSTVGAKIP